MIKNIHSRHCSLIRNRPKNTSLISLVVACALALFIFACPPEAEVQPASCPDEPEDPSGNDVSTTIDSLNIADVLYTFSGIKTSTEDNAIVMPFTIAFDADWNIPTSLMLVSPNSSTNLPANLDLINRTTNTSFTVTSCEGKKQEYILRITNGLSAVNISKKGDADAAIDWGDTVTITPDFPDDKTPQGSVSVEVLRESQVIDDTSTTSTYLTDNGDGTWDFAFTNPADKDNHLDDQRILMIGTTRYEFRVKASTDDGTDLTGATIHQLDNQGIRFTVKNLDLSALSNTDGDGARIMDLYLEPVGIDKIGGLFTNSIEGVISLPKFGYFSFIKFNPINLKATFPGVAIDNGFYIPFWTVHKKSETIAFDEQSDNLIKTLLRFSVSNTSYSKHTARINFSYDISGEDAIQEGDSFILYFSANATNIANTKNSGLFANTASDGGNSEKTTTLNITKGGAVTVQ